jgi:sugar lactone lactonase YvrE
MALWSVIGSSDGTGSAARFYYPSGVATDGTNLYIADFLNSTIRKVVISTGAVTTLAGKAGWPGTSDGTGSAARFHTPAGVTVYGGNLYVADTYNHTIRKVVISTGVVTTLAGTAGASGSDDGTGPAARFNRPYCVTTDGTNLYVADSENHTIRQMVLSSGEVTTLAGTAGASGSANGTGSAARFYRPFGITIDGGNLYVADTYNHTIRKIVISSAAVSTLAGTAGASGSNDGLGAAARFYYPWGIAASFGTSLYVADSANHTIRKIEIVTGGVTTLAGMAGDSGSRNGTGDEALFKNPTGVTTDGTSLYVADGENHTIRVITIAMAEVTTLAGTASVGSSDGTGTAARFYDPLGVTTDGTNLYVADTDNHTIRQVVIATGAVSTLAGTAQAEGSDDGTGADARFDYPRSIATDGTNLYVADTDNHTIRQIVISSGEVTTLAGTAGASGSDDATGAAARFNFPRGITTDGLNLYVVDTGSSTIRQIVISSKEVTTLAGTAGAQGSADGTGSAARFNNPHGVTTDGANLYVADTWNHTIRQIVISSREVSTLAGTAGADGRSDGTGTAARFNNPYGVTTDGTNVYVADTNNLAIRQVVISTAAVTTLAGGGGFGPGSSDGTGTAARFDLPSGIATDDTSLYIADSGNNTIRIGTK